VSPRARAPGRRRLERDAQPGLPIALPAPTPGSRLTPEASTPCAAPFDGDDWLFGVEWEGSRCLLALEADGSVRLQGETALLDHRYPEIVAGAALRSGHDAILDGTICVLDAQGRPDLEALVHRAADGMAVPPAVYLATDVLRLDGEPVTALPLRSRLETLAELVIPESRVQLPDHVVGHGRALAEAAAARGLAAIVARRRDAPYLAGVASRDRLRIALAGRRDAVVVGWHGGTGRGRVVLGDWIEGRLGIIGTAAVGSAWAKRWLDDNLESARDVVVDDRVPAGRGVRWVRPRMVATVDPGDERDPTGLAAWRLVTVRDDVDPRWCIRRPPVVPPQASAQEPLRPFSPTVLSPLPLGGAA
jgi:bifunctional non-homologous end joining protein LigD